MLRISVPYHRLPKSYSSNLAWRMAAVPQSGPEVPFGKTPAFTHGPILDKNELPALEPGAMAYMMSKQQYLNDRGKSWHPHVRRGYNSTIATVPEAPL